MENRTQISEIKSITKRTSGIELLRIIALGGGNIDSLQSVSSSSNDGEF